MKRNKPNKGSRNEWLSTFAVGERRYVETDLQSYPNVMRTFNTPKSRRRGVVEAMVFSTSLFTAVSAAKAGDIRYIVCVERAA